MTNEIFAFQYKKISDNTINNLSHKRLYFSDPATFKDLDDCRLEVDESGTEEQYRALIVKWNHCDPSDADKTLSDLVNKGHVKKEGDKYAFVRSPEKDNYRRDVKDLPRVCCFCKTRERSRMWEEHADNHQGICLCFRCIEETMPVDYKMYLSTQQGVVCPLYAVDYVVSIKDLIINMFDGCRHTRAHQRVCTKTIAYDYEDELRIIHNDTELKDHTLSYFEEDLEGIIFGSKINHKNAKSIHETVVNNYGNTVNFYKSIETSDKDKVEIIKIDDFDEYIKSISDV